MHILELGAPEHQEEESGTRPQDGVFRTVPKESTAFLVWKVSEHTAELLPRSHYGTFYDGEAYLVYSASLPGQVAGPDVIRREIKEGSSGGERHIHIWAGERSGTLGSTAVKRASELITHLGAKVVLHREHPTKESPRLHAYFKDGLRLLRSGSSGNARLYRVRGRRPVLQQLATVSWSQLSSDGVYVLDTPSLLFMWIGRAANLVEKIFGAKIAYRLARGDKAMTARRICITHDGYEQTLPMEDRGLLHSLLDLRARAIRPPEPKIETSVPARLYRVQLSKPQTAIMGGNRAHCRLEEVKRAPLRKEDLNEDSVYVVDAGSRGVWAWRGAGGGARAMVAALAQARALARARRYQCQVSCAVSGMEPLEFCALFAGGCGGGGGWGWSDARREGRSRAARSATTRLDAASLLANAWLAAETGLVDDGSGSLRVWRVRRASERTDRGPLCELTSPQNGVFFRQDCYLVLYTYHATTGDNTIIYYWMGGSSPNDLRNLGAKEAKDLYIKLGRLPVQVRVYEGKEPSHFLQIFKGRMVTYIGSATDYDPLGNRVRAPPRALIRVSGQYAREARGTELRPDLEPDVVGRGSCYVVREGARAWVWCGASATGDEREVAKHMAAQEHVLVMQGKEKDDFWAAIGDRKHLLVTQPLDEVDKPLPPRLFYVSLGVPDQYTFEEIIQFNQYELLPEMLAVLDAHCTLFVWCGVHSCTRTRDHTHLVADAYLRADPAARDLQTPVFIVSQGREPPNFTGFFPHWKPTIWKGHKTFSAIVSALEGKAIVQSNTAVQNGSGPNDFDQHEKYPLAVLRGPLEHIPSHLDPLAKELYLTHDDFVAAFGMPYKDFRTLPSWKQKDLKKAVGLF